MEQDCSKDSVINVFDASDLAGQDLSEKIQSIIEKYATLCSVDVKNELLVYVLGSSEKVKIVKRVSNISLRFLLHIPYVPKNR